MSGGISEGGSEGNVGKLKSLKPSEWKPNSTTFDTGIKSSVDEREDQSLQGQVQ